MRKAILRLSLIAVLSGLTIATHAGDIVVWHDDFDQFPVGSNSDDATYGAVAYNFTAAGFGHPRVVITNDLPDTLSLEPSYTHTNNCAFLFETDPVAWTNALNFGLRINRIPVVGSNTNTSPSAYTLNVDVAVQGTDIGSIGGFVAPGIGIYGNNSGEYFGDGCESNVPT